MHETAINDHDDDVRAERAIEGAPAENAHDPQRRRVKPTAKPPRGEGDRGREVKWVQKHLRAAGCDPRHEDGKFDERPRGALEQFQRRSALAVTGRVDPATWRKLSHARMEAKDGVDPTQLDGRAPPR